MTQRKNTTIFPRTGWTVEQTINYAIDTAKRNKTTVEFEINDILLTVDRGSNIATIKNLYLKLLNAKSK